MARLPTQNKILPEDFPKQDFMPQLLAPINKFFQDMILALNKGLTFQQNMAAEILTVNIDGNFPLDVRWVNKSKSIGAWIVNCRETSGSHVTFTTPLYLDWEMKSTDTFKINSIVGLSATSTNVYTVTIIAITG